MTTNGATSAPASAALDLRSLSTLIFDLDGVIWRGDEPIEGAAEAVARLRAAGKRCLYCTNNSKATPKQFAEKLRAMNIELEDDDVITSSVATAMYLSAQFTGPFLVYVIGEEGILSALQKIGAHIVPDIDVTDETMVDCVVVGIDRSFNYEKLRIAQQLIHKGANFIATNRDNTFPTENGIVPGAGSIVSSVEAASGVTPVTIGKPRPAMVQLVMSKFGVAPGQVAMIGDRLDTDIACARRAGITALFVATGVTPMAQARRGKGEQRADAFFEDLAALSSALLSDAPYVEARVSAGVAGVAQGTPSGLQNATDAQPDAPINLVPLEAAFNQSAATPATAPPGDAGVASFEGDGAGLDAAAPPGNTGDIFTDATAAGEPASIDDDWLTAEPASSDAEAADTIVFDEPVATSEPPFAEDNAATPGMADPFAIDTTEATTPAASAATENWDDSWFNADDEPATATDTITAESTAVAEPDFAAEPAFESTSEASADAAIGEASVDAPIGGERTTEPPSREADAFDLLDFDLSLPIDTPSDATSAGEEPTVEAAVPEEKKDEAGKADDGFNWKLD